MVTGSAGPECMDGWWNSESRGALAGHPPAPTHIVWTIQVKILFAAWG